MENFLLNIFNDHITTLISSGAVGAISWFFTKRHTQKQDLKKAKVSNDESQSDVVSKNLDLYQRMIDDIDERYKIRIKELELEISRLQTRINDLEKKGK